MKKCHGNPGKCYGTSGGGQYRIDPDVGYDISSFGIPEWRDVFEPFCVFRDIGDDVQKIEDRSQTEPDADAASSQKRRDAEADGSNLRLEQKVSKMQQEKFFHLEFLTYSGSDNKRGQDTHCIQDDDLQTGCAPVFRIQCVCG